MTIKEAAKEILKAHCSACYTRGCKVCAYNTALLAMLHPPAQSKPSANGMALGKLSQTNNEAP